MLGGVTEAAKMVTWPALVRRCGGTVCGRSGYVAMILRREFSATVLSLMVRASCKGFLENHAILLLKTLKLLLEIHVGL